MDAMAASLASSENKERKEIRKIINYQEQRIVIAQNELLLLVSEQKRGKFDDWSDRN